MADSTTHITQIEASQAQKEVTANGLFDAASPAMAYGRHAEACSGLTWGYYGTRFGGDVVANGTHACAASATTYMLVDVVTGAVSFSTDSGDWDDVDYARAYLITTGPSSVTGYEDHRFGPRGVLGAALTVNAGTVAYAPTTGSDWTDPDPDTVAEALDQLAERVTDIASPADRSAVSALTISSGVVNIDCALGDYFTLTLNANVTSITFSNLPASGHGASLMVFITQDSTPRTVAWPASFKWAGGSAGAVSTGSGAKDVLAISTFDAGTAWKATLAQAFA